MELLAAFAVRERVEPTQVRRILECATTEEAIPILTESGKRNAVMNRAAERVCYYMESRAGGRIKADCILYANAFGELAKSEGVEKWFTLLEREQEPRT